jgi:hypothetical protein
MSSDKVTMPLHQAKNLGHNLNTCRGLICKVYIHPEFKKAIMSYLNDSISTLQESVKLAEKGG